jgi:transcriptional regulator with GAF, ATPase, and Fis domain
VLYESTNENPNMRAAVVQHSRRFIRRAAIEDIVARDQLQALRQLTLELERQLESLNQSPTSSTEGSLDFYLEVQRFEIALIKEALRLAGGRQTKAAALLNLNSTTLNAMIKRYHIKPELLSDLT